VSLREPLEFLYEIYRKLLCDGHVIGLWMKFHGNAFIYKFSLFCLTYFLHLIFGGAMVILC
ncbi:MAG: hypothetical protein J7524_09275, partial [Roseofilum sp. Belize BBD 4]|uniref:hypothetical protein n=1 Tax=Roseofilum sp. Belize BBD 4 TaxID=2821500 RepID=UPI001B0748BE